MSEVLYTYDLPLPPTSTEAYMPANPPANEFESFRVSLNQLIFTPSSYMPRTISLYRLSSTPAALT